MPCHWTAVAARCSAALVAVLAAGCASAPGSPDSSLHTPAPSPTVSPAATATASSEEDARGHAQRLLDESRSLAAEGRTDEALARLDEAICVALDLPRGLAASPDYLEWAARLIGEADDLEDDLALIAMAAADGELVDLPPIEGLPAGIVSDDGVGSLLPASDFPLELNPTVLKFVDVMSQSGEYHNRIARGLARAGTYLPMIREKLAKAGLPQDLAYLPLIESAFSTTAYSRAKAHGMWQFISGTGRRYGLAVGSLLDERRDPELSTDAAIAYLRDLYLEFGDWNLALAGYNSGEGNVRRAIERSGSRDFWTLQNRLPKETRNYVPAFIASVIVSKQPERFGFPPIVEEDWTYDRIVVDDPLDLQFLAKGLDLQLADLRELNPAVRRDLTPPGRDTAIRLPTGYGARAEQLLAATPTAEWAPRTSYTVREGDTLSAIAKRHGSTVADIRQANGLRSTLIHPGQNLIVPRAGAASSSLPVEEETRRRVAHGGTYVVQRNDTLWQIARSFGVSLDRLCADNNLSPRQTIRPGQRLKVPGGASTAATPPPQSARAASVYTVRRGDTLFDIARRFGTTVALLQRANGLRGSRINPGDVLQIPGRQVGG
jgi:membrane-bound lytic murein transglycosylase D